MASSIAQYLKDFSAPQAPAMSFDTAFGGDDFGLEADLPALPDPEPDPIDIEAERKAAHDEAVEATTAELTARFAAEKAELEAAHAEAIAKLVQDSEEKTAAAVAAAFARMSTQLAGHLSEQVAVVLAPFLTEEITKTAISELCEQIEEAITEGEAVRINVSGPRTLYDKLAERLPAHDELLQHTAADDLDLTVEIGDQVLVTRISAWTASLRKVLG